MRDSLLPRRGAPPRKGRPARLLARLLCGGAVVALMYCVGLLFAARTGGAAPATSAAAARGGRLLSAGDPAGLPPLPRGGPDAGRGADADARPWWVS